MRVARNAQHVVGFARHNSRAGTSNKTATKLGGSRSQRHFLEVSEQVPSKVHQIYRTCKIFIQSRDTRPLRGDQCAPQEKSSTSKLPSCTSEPPFEKLINCDKEHRKTADEKNLAATDVLHLCSAKLFCLTLGTYVLSRDRGRREHGFQCQPMRVAIPFQRCKAGRACFWFRVTFRQR